MHYDALQKAYVDDDSGEVVYREDDEETVATASLTIVAPPTPPPVSRRVPVAEKKKARELEREFELVRMEAGEENLAALEDELRVMHANPTFQDSTYAAPPEGNAEYADWSFARTLQALEFEIPEGDDHEDFERKEYRASRSCRRQMLTASFFICAVQIGLMVAMIQSDGYDKHNSVLGPPVTTLVRFGAKEAGLICIKSQWWRLLSSVMLHGGIFHIIPNVAIQLRVGGYLNLVFGWWRWLLLYFSSGIFGSMLSCLFLPSAVGVGSSGALMGMLAAWVVWILFRWNKIPPACHKQRNCQLMVVVASIVITLATSSMPNVDWAAHLGGAVNGALWGFVLLAHELESPYRNLLRAGAAALSAFLFVFSICYMALLLHPTDYYFSLWDANDDWGR